MAEKLKRIFPILILLFLVLFFFLPTLTFQKIPYAGDFTGSDLTELNLPFRFLLQQSLRQGEIPLWTHLLSTGFPLLAEGQTGVFYPFNLILYGLLPFVAAVNISFWLNFFLAGLFSYFYCRTLKISKAGSLLAAIAFSFSGFFIFRLKHLNIINAAIWLPLEFYLIEKYFLAKKKGLVAITLSIVFAIQFFAGHPQISYICLLTAFIYFSLRFYSLRKAKEKAGKIIFKIIFLWLILGVLTFGLVAIQLLPTYELSQNSLRSGWMSFENSIRTFYNPVALFSFINPYIIGNPAAGYATIRGAFWENNIYFGLIPLLLAGYAIYCLWYKKPIVKIFLALLVICFFFIFAKHNPLFKFVWLTLPGLKMFRFHQRFLLPVLLILTTLAGIGLDLFLPKIFSFCQKKERLKKSKLFFRVLPGIIIFIVIIDLFFFAFLYIGWLPIDYFEAPKSAQFLKQDNDDFRIFSYNWQHSWREVYLLSDGWLTNLALYHKHRELIQPNLNIFYGLPAIEDRAWDPNEGGQLNKRLADFWLAFNNQVFRDQEKELTLFSKALLKIWGLQNVKYFSSFYNLGGEGLELKKEIRQDYLPPLKIYENKYFLPRAFAVFNSKIISDDEEIIAEMLDENFDPRQNIIIEKPVAPYRNNTSQLTNTELQDKLISKVEDGDVDRFLTGQAYEDGDELASSEVKITNLSSREIKIEVNLSKPGFLFLSQNYYPGWHVLVDGVEKDLLRANYAFSAVQVDSGSHQVKFYYQPKSYIIGRNITIGTIILIIIFFFWQLLYVKKKI